jgi:hypothetical protein
MRVVALVSLCLAACGCHAPKSAQTCPDNARARCLTAPVCSYDASRGCEVCHCGDPGYAPPERTPPR